MIFRYSKVLICIYYNIIIVWEVYDFERFCNLKNDALNSRHALNIKQAPHIEQAPDTEKTISIKQASDGKIGGVGWGVGWGMEVGVMEGMYGMGPTP